MNLRDLVARGAPSEHWRGPYKIPWNETDFSRRLLDEHLDQSHDAASRRSEIVDQHVEWIHHHVLGGRATRVLDLCCGPGLYTSRLARLGHDCTGIDFSPASLGYAEAEAADQKLNCRYIRGDIREAGYGSGYGLAMLLYGEFNVFPPAEIEAVLGRLLTSLAPGGVLVLEPQRADSVQRAGAETANWYRAQADLFCDRPHICLEEHFWDEEARVATDRYYVIEADSREVTEYTNSRQAYSHEELARVVTGAGFEELEFYESLTGEDWDVDEDLMVLCARKP